jgi:hypothetical protein
VVPVKAMVPSLTVHEFAATRPSRKSVRPVPFLIRFSVPRPVAVPWIWTFFRMSVVVVEKVRVDAEVRFELR